MQIALSFSALCKLHIFVIIIVVIIYLFIKMITRSCNEQSDEQDRRLSDSS